MQILTSAKGHRSLPEIPGVVLKQVVISSACTARLFNNMMALQNNFVEPKDVELYLTVLADKHGCPLLLSTGAVVYSHLLEPA